MNGQRSESLEWRSRRFSTLLKSGSNCLSQRPFRHCRGCRRCSGCGLWRASFHHFAPPPRCAHRHPPSLFSAIGRQRLVCFPAFSPLVSQCHPPSGPMLALTRETGPCSAHSAGSLARQLRRDGETAHALACLTCLQFCCGLPRLVVTRCCADCGVLCVRCGGRADAVSVVEDG